MSGTCLSQRNVKVTFLFQVSQDLDLHIRYAICKAVNAAFILLSDEDSEVRMLATRFVSKLDSGNLDGFGIFPFSGFQNLSTVKASKKLVFFALSELNECADW